MSSEVSEAETWTTCPGTSEESFSEVSDAESSFGLPSDRELEWQQGCGAACAFEKFATLASSVHRPLSADGSCTIEVFAGVAAVTCGLLFHKVPSMVLWDIASVERLNVVTHTALCF